MLNVEERRSVDNLDIALIRLAIQALSRPNRELAIAINAFCIHVRCITQQNQDPGKLLSVKYRSEKPKPTQ